MRTSLPYELLADIVQLLFEELPPHRVPAPSSSLELKPPWSRIHAVVLASRTLRAIGLRLWFCRLRSVSSIHPPVACAETSQSEERMELGLHILHSRHIQLGQVAISKDPSCGADTNGPSSLSQGDKLSQCHSPPHPVHQPEELPRPQVCLHPHAQCRQTHRGHRASPVLSQVPRDMEIRHYAPSPTLLRDCISAARLAGAAPSQHL